MKRRKMFGCLLFLALLLLTGCGSRKKEEDNSYTVYYVNTSRTRLMEASYRPQAQTFEEMVEELQRELQNAPSGFVSAVPENVTFNGYERGIDALRIDFSGEYYDLSNTDEVLLRAAVVKTFSQVPGVAGVMITVGGEQLHDLEGKPVPAMDADSFIDTKEGGINSYQYATLSLYFADESGERLVRERRNLHFSSNMVLERMVVEQLIAGPEESGLRPVLTEGVRIQNLYTQDGVCTINFDAEVNRTPSEQPLDATAALYAIVDSICETCDDITSVRFEIDGESETLFRGEVDLNQFFMMNREVIERDEIETELPRQAETEKP